MIKGRFQDPAQRVVAQRVVAHALDVILRLLHPLIPFITEEIWQMLGTIAPQRGLTNPEPAARHLMAASWPHPDPYRVRADIEEQFAQFHAVLSALREIRSRQNLPTRQVIPFSLRCDENTARLLQPLAPQFAALAEAEPRAMGPEVEPPATHATIHLATIDVIVDLAGLIDVEAEMARLEKQVEWLIGMIAGKEKKLSNASFVEKAPADVVRKEQESLQQLRDQLQTAETSLAALAKST